ncbi:MAG: L,D-transpeptidase [Haloechinothrix sp.]
MVTSAVAGVLAVALVLGVLMWLGSASNGSTNSADPPKVDKITRKSDKPRPVGVTVSNTYTTIASAPQDPSPRQETEGLIVHPRERVPVYAKPGGKQIATMEPTQLGDTWLPVINGRPGWVQVLLPSRPNGSTGWLRDSQLDRAYTPYLIRVHLASMRLELILEGRETGSWPIGIGKRDTPTPTGRTFLLGSIVDPKQRYSPVILPLGSHSDTLDSFGGGPGTVAIHTWPTTDVLGTASSHGCIRVPKDALNRLTEVPLGTLVLVDQR